MPLPTIPKRVRTLDTRRLRPAPKRVDPFYVSKEWRKFIAEVIRERGPSLMARQGHLCEDPRCKAQHTAKTRVFGDHVVELQDGGAPFDRANIMLRCGSSHTTKTVQERVKRLAEGGGSKV